MNDRTNYIPFDIRLPSGTMQPAKYIKLEYGEDPLIYGMIDRHIMTHNFVEVFGRFNVTICLTARESPRRPIL